MAKGYFEVLKASMNMLVAILLLFVFSGSALAFSPAEVYRCTNEIRKELHVPRLRNNRLLQKAAMMKLLDMERYGYWSHENPVTHEYAWPLMDRVGYVYLEAGENLGIGFDTAKDVCDAWKQSPTHLENIVSTRYRDVGIAIKLVDLGKKKGVLVVQIFGRR